MEIRLGSQVRDAKEAEGTAIIIDVFRAFTTAAIAFDHGVREITLVDEAEDALEGAHRAAHTANGSHHLRLRRISGCPLWAA